MPAPTPTVLLSGATGLVGGLILDALLAAPTGWRVVAPTRRPLRQSDPRLNAPALAPTDPAGETAVRSALPVGQPLQAWICALGTTLASAGSREAFRAVDLDLVLATGRMARELGAAHGIVVSSVGAHPASRNFYLSVKGAAEEALKSSGFVRLDLLQPGLLLGPRPEMRRGEAIGQRLAPWFNPLLLGPLRRYRAVPAQAVARTAVRLLAESAGGCFVHRFDELQV